MGTMNFIANGKRFSSLAAVESYARENGWRIQRTEKVKGKTLVYLGR